MRKFVWFVRKRKSSPFFRVCWRCVDETHYREKSLGFRDRHNADAAASKFMREMEDEACGLIAPKSLRDGAAEPLEGHLAVYLTQLAGGGDSGDWVRTVGYRLRILLRECAWVYGRDINAKSFLRWRDGVTAPAARTTKNQYVDAVCMFCGWLADGGILSHSPLSRGLLRIDGRGVEPSRKRRALTDAEFGRLLFGAGAFKPFIVVASLTGLRRGEMKSFGGVMCVWMLLCRFLRSVAVRRKMVSRCRCR